MGQDVRKLLEPFVRQLSRHSHLRPGDSESLLSLSGRSETVSVHRDADHLGEALQSVSLVAEGFLGKFHQTRSGGRQITTLYVPGDIANLQSLLFCDAGAGVVALSPARIVRLPKEELATLAAVSAPISRALWRECAAEASRSSRWLLNLGRHPVRTAMAHLYCEVASRISGAVPAQDRFYAFPVVQSHLADMLGSSLVHVNRTLQTLRSERLIEVRPQGFRILDWDGLAYAAEFDPEHLCLDTTLRSAA